MPPTQRLIHQNWKDNKPTKNLCARARVVQSEATYFSVCGYDDLSKTTFSLEVTFGVSSFIVASTIPSLQYEIHSYFRYNFYFAALLGLHSISYAPLAFRVCQQWFKTYKVKKLQAKVKNYAKDDISQPLASSIIVFSHDS